MKHKKKISLFLALTLIVTSLIPVYAAPQVNYGNTEKHNDINESIESTLASISSLQEGEDYVKDEIVFMADSYREAIEGAREYHAKLLSYREDTGIGVARISDDIENTFKTASVDSENIHIIASPNYIYHICDDIAEAFENTEDAIESVEEISENAIAASECTAEEVIGDVNYVDGEALTEEDSETTEDVPDIMDTRSKSSSYYNDPFIQYGLQWYFDDVKAVKAHQTGYTGKNIVVAILDTGISLNHEDLQGKVRNAYSYYDDSVEDDNGHGTHCAGIIAANKNNNIGGVGVAPDAMLDIYKVMDGYGQGTSENISDAIIRAANNGANVISMSIGSNGSDYDYLEHEAIKTAYNKGCICVAAAGNSYDNKPHFPASFREVLSVGASRYDKNDAPRLGIYSNYGDWVDVVAPGGFKEDYKAIGDVTDRVHQKDYSGLENDSKDGILSTWKDNGYCITFGTSMACPVVAGIAALICEKNPDILAFHDAKTSDTIKDHIKATTDGRVYTYLPDDTIYLIKGGRVQADVAVTKKPAIHQNRYSDDYGQIPDFFDDEENYYPDPIPMQEINQSFYGYNLSLKVCKSVPYTKKKQGVLDNLSYSYEITGPDGEDCGIIIKKIKATNPKKKTGISKVTFVLKGSTKMEKKAVKKLNKKIKNIQVQVENW